MARPRVHRHDVRCPECGSNRMPKDGTSQGRQVYHCSNCGHRAIPNTDGYRVYGWLPSDRHQVGKGGAVNWNEGCIRGVGVS